MSKFLQLPNGVELPLDDIFEPLSLTNIAIQSTSDEGEVTPGLLMMLQGEVGRRNKAKQISIVMSVHRAREFAEAVRGACDAMDA